MIDLRRIVAEEVEKAFREELETKIREIVRKKVKEILNNYELDEERLEELIREAIKV